MIRRLLKRMFRGWSFRSTYCVSHELDAEWPRRRFRYIMPPSATESMVMRRVQCWTPAAVFRDGERWRRDQIEMHRESPRVWIVTVTYADDSGYQFVADAAVDQSGDGL